MRASAAPDIDIYEASTTVHAELYARTQAQRQQLRSEIAGTRDDSDRRTPTRPAADDALIATPLTMVQALNHALHDAMAADDGCWFRRGRGDTGGVFRVTEGLTETSAWNAASIPAG